MIKQGFVFLLAAFLATEVSSAKIQARRIKLANPKPYGLTDEAQVKVEELRETVEAAITTSYNSLAGLNLDFVSKSDNILQTAHLSIQEQVETVQAEVTVIRDLGYIAGVDVSPCVDIREQVLNRLSDAHEGELRECVFGQNREAARIETEARYFVDVYINNVNALQFDLDRCPADNILCIDPVVNQADLYMVQLPQSIAIEVDRATDLLEALKPAVEECSDTHVSAYVDESNSIVRDIIACVSRLLP